MPNLTPPIPGQFEIVPPSSQEVDECVTNALVFALASRKLNGDIEPPELNFTINGHEEGLGVGVEYSDIILFTFMPRAEDDEDLDATAAHRLHFVMIRDADQGMWTVWPKMLFTDTDGDSNVADPVSRIQLITRILSM